ncbi:MAG: signal recognition particle-docking protein FtsY [bacterium]|jgi:fused signal recognition particle receptor
MFSRLKQLKESLSKTRDNLLGKIGRLISGRKIDDALIDDIEEALLKADVGVRATQKIIEHLHRQASESGLNDEDSVLRLLKAEIAGILARQPSAALSTENSRPLVWLITGVNGTGKTTTVGKLAHYLKSQGKEVMIAACDTFRAAAVDQLAIWAERSGVHFVRAQSGADPASVAFDAATSAKNKNIDYLLVDTAGRLHTKANLMEELRKIRRVTEKVVPPEQIKATLVIDGTTGQNALSQVKIFTDTVGCDSLVITKLDGTARGGVIIAIAEELSVPVDFIGIGEKIDDLQPFDPKEFVEALFEN